MGCEERINATCSIQVVCKCYYLIVSCEFESFSWSTTLSFSIVCHLSRQTCFNFVMKGNRLSSYRELCVVMTKWTGCIKATNHLSIRELPFNLNFPLQVIEAGANALVAGSAVFGAPDYAEGKDINSLFSHTEKFRPYCLLITRLGTYITCKFVAAIKGIKTSKRPEAVAVWGSHLLGSSRYNC